VPPAGDVAPFLIFFAPLRAPSARLSRDFVDRWICWKSQKGGGIYMPAMRDIFHGP
jgi:hypothetical protein